MGDATIGHIRDYGNTHTHTHTHTHTYQGVGSDLGGGMLTFSGTYVYSAVLWVCVRTWVCVCTERMYVK